MSDLDAEFTQAQDDVNKLADDPGNNAKLKLYSLYKQATTGDVQGKRPGFTNPVGRAKYDAWKKEKGLGQDDAMQQYVDLVKRLQGREHDA
jgi:acyl-CoA-binding protein